MWNLPKTPGRSQQKDFPYFRRLRGSIVTVLFAASFVPLVLIGGGMYYYAASVLKQKALDSLRMEVVNHKEVIDQFLSERVTGLRLVSENAGLNALTSPGGLEAVFQSLQSAYDGSSLADLGIINDQGRHLAYVGPFELISRNYQDAAWFKEVMKRGVYVSDVFLGFRNKPHFIIAVKQQSGERSWIIRATVDSDSFNSIVSEVDGNKGGDAYLVDRNGIYQTRPRKAGDLMGNSGFKDLKSFQGVRLVESQGKLLATVWLEAVPWLCAVEIDERVAFEALHRTRNIGIIVFVFGSILIILTVLFTTNHLVSRLETKRRSIRFLSEQLRHTSYMASSMELTYGFFREINDTLSNIDVTASWIQDLTRDGGLSTIQESLAQIKSEVSRSKKSIEKFLRFIGPGSPVIRDVNVNEILEDLLEFLDSELHFKNIRVTQDFQDHLPSIRSNRPKLRQVFQNIILNAMAAIEKDGEVILATRSGEGGIKVTITDDGPGIPEENLGKIFDPLFTTKSEGTGLGLPVCLNILERLGGRISVKSEAEKGTSFTVELPFQFKPPEG
jgi:two-component system NtrC family sensor kinase